MKKTYHDKHHKYRKMISIVATAILLSILTIWAISKKQSDHQVANEMTERYHGYGNDLNPREPVKGSFPYMLAFLYDQTDQIHLELNICGESPLFDLTVEIVDSQQQQQDMKQLEGKFLNISQTIRIMEMNPNTVQELERIYVDRERDIEIHYTAKNGIFYQHLKIIKSKNGIKLQTQVLRKTDGKILFAIPQKQNKLKEGSTRMGE